MLTNETLRKIADEGGVLIGMNDVRPMAHELLTLREAVAPQMTEVDALEAACDQNFLDNVDTTLPLDEQGLALTGLINCAKSLASRLRTAILACEKEKQRADDAEKIIRELKDNFGEMEVGA